MCTGDERTQVGDKLERLQKEKELAREEHAAALEKIREDELSASKQVDETVEKFAREQKVPASLSLSPIVVLGLGSTKLR